MTPVRKNTVDGLVHDSARRVPDRLALRYRTRTWTYAELDAAVSSGAAVLRERYGLAEGDRVATFGHNSDAYLLAFLACARGGLTHVPVNQNLTGEDLAYILENSGSSLVLADPELEGRIPAGHSVRPLRDAPGSFLAELAELTELTELAGPGESAGPTAFARSGSRPGWCNCCTPPVRPPCRRAR